MILQRLLEFLPLAFVLGTTMGALRNETLPDIQRAALKNTAKIVIWLAVGCLLLEGLLQFVQD